jgi:hypothetical protein
MPQTINTFVKSKMNKDLDDRLLSNGEYRDAQNVNVSRSEGEDVGALENVLGNTLLSDFGLSAIPGLEIIGFLADEVNNRAFFIATNYTDPSTNELDNSAPYGVNCYVLMRDNKTGTSSTLVSGRFLNFSKTHPVYGIDLIEDLLFWTDNRNQPRKINVTKAIADGSFYNSEDLISVAKYYPYEAMQLHNTVTVTKSSSANNGEFKCSNTDIAKLHQGMILLSAATSPSNFLCFIDRIVQPTGSNLGIVFLNKFASSLGAKLNFMSKGLQNASNLWLPPSSTAQLLFQTGTSPSTITISKISGEVPRRAMRVTNASNPGLNSWAVDSNLLVDTVTASSGSGATLELSVDDISENYTFLDTSFTVGATLASPTGSLNTVSGSGASLPQTIIGGRRGSNATATITKGGSTNISDLTITIVDPGGGYSIGETVTIAPFTSSGGLTEVSSTITYVILANVLQDSRGQILEFSSPNGEGRTNWPGDSEFLKEKFVRFAYRFKFNDGEYSLISPFTQPAFIPKQGGYMIDRPSREEPDEYLQQEESIGSSTIVSFFENNVDNVFLNINTPVQVLRMAENFGIEEIDILYKESDALAIKVLETIPVTDSSITGNSTNIYTYNYQSRKPFKTLPNREATRVFDKVPVRAMSQSIVGNRVVYGNYLDKHSPPENLDYNASISNKYPSFSTTENVRNYARTSYPAHTVKQNRTYQVGVVLADRYGRQSDVILSSLDATQFQQASDTTVFDGSTIFHPYRTFLQGGTLSSWPGDSLKVLFRSVIPSTQTGEYAEGYPGLYASGLETAEVRANTSSTNVIPVKLFSPNIVLGSILQDGSDTYTVIAISRGDDTDSTITLSENKNVTNGDVLNFKTPENKLGWYTYKIVVKQTEQDYYNLYLPNVCQASPESSLNNSSNSGNQYLESQSFFTSLISDNINKLSSDLQEVQPEQTQFRTSDDILFPRVGYNPDIGDSATVYTHYAANYYVEEEIAVVNNIAKVTDMGVQEVNLNGVDTGRIKGLCVIGGASANLTTAGVTTGRVVYNVPIISEDGSGSGGRVKVKVNTVSGSPSLNYLVITHPGKDYANNDTIKIAAYNASSPGYVDGQSTWAEFTIPRFTAVTSPVSIVSQTEGWKVGTTYGTDLTPLSAQGIYNASSNPSVAQLSTNGKFIIGATASDNMVFSAIEIKPLDSKLELFWETSTCGLVSELNSLIETTTAATTISPGYPVE